MYLADVEGLSCREIAETRGTPVSTTTSRIHRGHQELRQLLPQYTPRVAHGVTACHRRGGSQDSTVSLLTNQPQQYGEACPTPRVSPSSKYAGNPVRESQDARTEKENSDFA
ncbi:hypothetical protein ABZV80_21980 [Streptomyces sp. NPDC005132]|uniref:hypothetical protein n=1 Tax=Streptomyces sp. NPDC005132 TaxID=3154294 RepID=UPI0033BB6BA6